MNSLRMNIILGLGIVIALMSQSASGKTAGFSQSSFISTSGGMAAGAADSSVIGTDGIKKGECSYTSSEGEYISIKYEESRDGKTVTGKISGGEKNASAKKTLTDCRASMANLQLNFDLSTKETNDKIAEFEKNTFKDEMDDFNDLHDKFSKHQKSLFGQMEDFMKAFDF